MGIVVERVDREEKRKLRQERMLRQHKRLVHLLPKLKQEIRRLKTQISPPTNLTNKIIAVDFDGTLCTDNYPEIGKPNYYLINKLKLLSKNNTLILWTCRTGDLLEDAVVWCKKHKIHFHYINENAKEVLEKYNFKDSRKITADIYLDDKSRRTL